MKLLFFILLLAPAFFEPLRELDVEAKRLELAQQNGKVVLVQMPGVPIRLQTRGTKNPYAEEQRAG